MPNRLRSIHEELNSKSLFLPKVLCLTIFSLCRIDRVNCTKNQLFLGFFFVCGLWDNIVCHAASLASVVKVWLLTEDVPKNITSIAFYISRKKVMNYIFNSRIFSIKGKIYLQYWYVEHFKFKGYKVIKIK